MSSKMLLALRNAIKNCNGQAQLAERINSLAKGEKLVKKLTTNNVARWVSLGQTPARWVLAVEKVSKIPCWELRPDLYPPERFSY